MKINHKLNGNDKCLVYFLTCNVCLKQYVGQTVEELRYRWNNYKNNGCKYQEYGTCVQQHLFEHFSEEAHHSFLKDVSITLIDKTGPSNPLQRENYWRSTLKTMVPWWLNIEDCVWSSILLYSYLWIYTECNKDLIYDFGTDYCYYLHHYHCCCCF